MFDEFHHGYTERPSFLSLLSLEGTLAASLQLAFCGALYVLVLGRRMGPPLEPRSQARPTPLRYLEAAGELYLEQCTPGEIAAAYGASAARALARSGGPEPAGPATTARSRAARRAAAKDREIQALLGRAALAPDSGMGTAEALALIARLDQALGSIQHGGRSLPARFAPEEKRHARTSPSDR